MRVARTTLASLLLLAAPAAAQSTLSGGVEIASDERRRGLSWSDGDAVVSADLAGGIAGLDASARIVATRGARRHDGADAVADLALGKRWQAGAITLDGGGIAHLFAGAGRRMDYGELSASAQYSYAIALIRAGIDWAPPQAAIGGSVVHLHAGISAGLPGTPLTLSAAIGRSMGTGNGARAQRLRPGGDYTDWRVGVEHVRDRITLGLDYSGTDIPEMLPGATRLADVRNSGDRVMARARLSF